MTKERRVLNKEIDTQYRAIGQLERTVSKLKSQLRREKAILQFLLRKPKPKPDKIV